MDDIDLVKCQACGNIYNHNDSWCPICHDKRIKILGKEELNINSDRMYAIMEEIHEMVGVTFDEDNICGILDPNNNYQVLLFLYVFSNLQNKLELSSEVVISLKSVTISYVISHNNEYIMTFLKNNEKTHPIFELIKEYREIS